MPEKYVFVEVAIDHAVMCQNLSIEKSAKLLSASRKPQISINGRGDS
jgi:hypothetical protein